MSHRAIIAVKQAQNSYNIHFSPNGAQNLQLTDILLDNLRGNDLDIQSIAGGDSKLPKQAEQWAKTGRSKSNVVMGTIDNNMIETTPWFTGVPLEQVSETFEYDNIEAFFLVRNGNVETYFPVWLEPNVVRPFREHSTIEVYTRGKLSKDVEDAFNELEETDPQRVIDSETLAGTEWTEDTITWDVILRNHEALTALQRNTLENLNEKFDEIDREDIKERDELECVLQSGGRYIKLKTDQAEPILPNSLARGVLIKIDNNDTIEYSNVRDAANEERMKTGTRLNKPKQKPTEEDLSEEASTLFRNLLKRYPDQISPLSPKPFGQLIKKVNKIR